MSQPITSPGHDPDEGTGPSPDRPADAPTWTAGDRGPGWDAPGTGPQAGYYPPPSAMPPAYGAYPPPARRTNTMAVIALVSGIAGLTVLPVLGSIVAVILGPIARREIAGTGEDGAGMVTAAVIMGWIGIGLGVLLLVLAVGAMILAFGLAATVSTV